MDENLKKANLTSEISTEIAERDLQIAWRSITPTLRVFRQPNQHGETIRSEEASRRLLCRGNHVVQRIKLHGRNCPQLFKLLKGCAQFHVGMYLFETLRKQCVLFEDGIPTRVDVHGDCLECQVGSIWQNL